jgi:hypothetical protein
LLLLLLAVAGCRRPAPPPILLETPKFSVELPSGWSVRLDEVGNAWARPAASAAWEGHPLGLALEIVTGAPLQACTGTATPFPAGEACLRFSSDGGSHLHSAELRATIGAFELRLSHSTLEADQELSRGALEDLANPILNSFQPRR